MLTTAGMAFSATSAKISWKSWRPGGRRGFSSGGRESKTMASSGAVPRTAGRLPPENPSPSAEGGWPGPFLVLTAGSCLQPPSIRSADKAAKAVKWTGSAGPETALGPAGFRRLRGAIVTVKIRLSVPAGHSARNDEGEDLGAFHRSQGRDPVPRDQ